MRRKIKIAFIKYGGLTSGGSEKLLQIIAANLPKNIFEVTFFYSKLASNHDISRMIPSVDEGRKSYLLNHGVILKEFTVGKIDFLTPFYKWQETNFFSVFDESNFDIIQTCRVGRKESPFNLIRRAPIVDIIALSSGVDNQFNVSRVIHLSKWSSDLWIKKGGDPSRVLQMSLPIDLTNMGTGNFKQKYKLDNFFVFGLHQRASDSIFSEIPLNAYKEIENEKTAFLMLGGSEKYQQQAKDLGIKNITFIPFSSDPETIFSFLRTLDVYCHGRKDGEINSQAIAEALSQGLPVISHRSVFNNGQIEGIGDAGRVVDGIRDYAQEMQRLMDDKNYFLDKKERARKRFLEVYSLEKQMEKYSQLYYDVIKNPFPNKARRVLYSLHYTQNIRIAMIWFYLKIKKGLLSKR